MSILSKPVSCNYALTIKTNKGDIELMFNPVDYNVIKDVQKTGKGGKIQFNTVDVSEFSVKLFFDTYENKKKTDAIRTTFLIISK